MRYHERAARFIVHKVRLVPEDALHQMLGRELKRVEPEVVVFAYYDRVSFQSENGKVQVSKSYGYSHIDDHFYITFDENELVPHSNPKKMRKGITFVVKLNPGGHVLGKLLVRLDAINGLGLDKGYNEFQLGHSVIRIGLSIKIMEISDIPSYVVYDIQDNNKNQGFRAFMMERRRIRLAEGNDGDDMYYGDDGEGEDALGDLLRPRQASMEDIYNKALNQSARINENEVANSARTSDRMITARTHFTGTQTPQQELEKFQSVQGSIEQYSSLPTAYSMNYLPNPQSSPQNRPFQRSLTQVDKRQQLSRQGSSRKDILAKVNPAFLNAHRPNENQQQVNNLNNLVLGNESKQLKEGANIPPTVWMHPIDEGKEDRNTNNNNTTIFQRSPFVSKQNSKALRKSKSFHLQLSQDDKKLGFGSNESTRFPSPVMILTARQLQEFQESSQNQLNNKNIQQIKEEVTEENNNKNGVSQQTRLRHESNDSSMYQFDFDMNQRQKDVYNNSARSRHQLDGENEHNEFGYERPDFEEDMEWNRSNLARKQSYDAHMEIQGTKSSGLVMKQSNGQLPEDESLAKQSIQKGVILQTLSERGGEEVQGGNRSEDFQMVNSKIALNHPETPSFGDSNNINHQDANVATDASYNYGQMEGISTFNNTPASDAPLRVNPTPIIPPLRLEQLRTMAQQTEVEIEDAEIQATQTMVDAQVMNSARLGPQLQDFVAQVMPETMDEELQLDPSELEPTKPPPVHAFTQAGKPPPQTVDFGIGGSPRNFSDLYVQAGYPLSQTMDSCVGNSPRLQQEMQTQAGSPPVETVDTAVGQNLPTILADAETQFGKPPAIMMDENVGSSPRIYTNVQTQAGKPPVELVDTGVGSSPRTFVDTCMQASPTQQDSYTVTTPREMVSQDVQVMAITGEVQVQTDPVEPQVIVIPPPPPPPKPEMVDFGVQEDLPIVQEKEESVLPMMFVVNQDPPSRPATPTNEIQIQTDIIQEEIADENNDEQGRNRSLRNSSNLSQVFGRGDSVKISIDIEDDSHSHAAQSHIERQLSMRSLSELSFHESTPATKTDQGQDPVNFQQINFQVPQIDDVVLHGRSSSGEGASGRSGKSFDTQHSQVATSPGKEAESGIPNKPERKTSGQNSEVGANTSTKDADVQSVHPVPLGETAFSRRAFGSEINLTESGFQSFSGNTLNQLEPVVENGSELMRGESRKISWSEMEDDMGRRKSTGEMEVQTDMFGRERSSSIISQPSDQLARVDTGDTIHQDSVSLKTDTSIAQTKTTTEMGIGADFPIALSKRSRSQGIDILNKGISTSLDDEEVEVTAGAIYRCSTAGRKGGRSSAFCKSGIIFDSTEGLGLPESFRRENFKPRKYSRLEGANDNMLTQENLKAHHARYGRQTQYDWVLDEEDMIRYGMGQSLDRSRLLHRAYSQEDDLFQRRLGSQRQGSDADGASGRLSPSPSFGKKHESNVYTSSRSRQIQPGDKQPGSRPSTPGWSPGPKKYSATRNEQSLEQHKNWIRRMLGEESDEKSSIRSRVVTPQQAPKPSNKQQKPVWVELARAKMRKLVSIQREREAQRIASPEPEDGITHDMVYSERGVSAGRNSVEAGSAAVRDPSPIRSVGSSKRMVSPLRHSKTMKSPLIPKPVDSNEQQAEPEWRRIIRERKLKQQQSFQVSGQRQQQPNLKPEIKLPVQKSNGADTPRTFQPSLSSKQIQGMYQKMDTLNHSRKQQRPAARPVTPPIPPPAPPPPPPTLAPRVRIQTVKAEVKKEIEFKAKNAPHLAGKVGALKNFFDFAKREN